MFISIQYIIVRLAKHDKEIWRSKMHTEVSVLNLHVKCVLHVDENFFDTFDTWINQEMNGIVHVD